ncbi:YjdF family protein [Ruminococcus albus]|uniref:DUF2992 family protein n=1 Tax=Ruminococcus albus TaxID=1264 RepID=A0A1H7M8S4_RUMAL|nr:YjdF family protein [Ruminococcus albus]SEL07593.1 Protein of unknown function [Ruminococcus albus]
MEGKLTVYFDDPFWVGVFERCDVGKLSVCRVTFGAEPTDCEVYGFALRHWDELPFSKAIEAEKRKTADNPKRRQRNARKQMAQKGIGTKSQQALQKQLEENKLERKVRTREEKQEEAKRLFELKQQKKKEKHKGR